MYCRKGLSVNVLFYDIEISPILGWAYEKWNTNLIRVEQNPVILCFSYKWKGGHVANVALPDFKGYDPDHPDDREISFYLRDILDGADVVVAHNAKRFDNRIASGRFLVNGVPPPSPYRTVDTLLSARKYFRLPSNSLNDLCVTLGIGQKPSETHSDLWRDCLKGDTLAWSKMQAYCNHDVVLLEKLYYRMLPYMSNHPTIGGKHTCPRCNSLNIQRRGFAHTNAASYQRFVCNDCGAWSRERVQSQEHDRPNLISVI